MLPTLLLPVLLLFDTVYMYIIIYIYIYIYILDGHNPLTKRFFFVGRGLTFMAHLGPSAHRPSFAARGQLLFCRCGVLDGAACRSCSTKETLRSSSRHGFLGRRMPKGCEDHNMPIMPISLAKFGISWEKLPVISGRKHEWKQQMRRQLAIMCHGRHYERIGLTVI